MTYERPKVNELASCLGIKPKVLEGDIRDLAWLWEMTLGDMDLHNPLGALDVLAAIARAYIRGRNCRMGSYQTMWKHLPTKAAMIYHLIRYVCEENDPERAYVPFPHLHACGLTSVNEFLALVNKLSTERIRRQEEEEIRKAEEAKRAGQQKVTDIIQNLRAERQGNFNILEEIRRFVDGDERGRP